MRVAQIVEPDVGQPSKRADALPRLLWAIEMLPSFITPKNVGTILESREASQDREGGFRQEQVFGSRF